MLSAGDTPPQGVPDEIRRRDETAKIRTVMLISELIPPTPTLWTRIRWLLRGLSTSSDLHQLCRRCHQPGIAHWWFAHCWRFKRPRRPDLRS